MKLNTIFVRNIKFVLDVNEYRMEVTSHWYIVLVLINYGCCELCWYHWCECACC